MQLEKSRLPICPGSLEIFGSTSRIFLKKSIFFVLSNLLLGPQMWRYLPPATLFRL
jgi:hypothetical protein